MEEEIEISGITCETCDKLNGQEPHTCPYKSEIDNDNDSLCTCCKNCEHECEMDI